MPTTSNFGWTTPADTDYVKDGALAIRTLANGIDTSLVDLKGGTTGQILSKNSNTDLDYTWINNDQGDITAVNAGTGISVTNPTGPTPTVAIDSTVATLTGTQTLTNKTIALGSNTVSGTTAQFNTALTDGDFATLAGTETLTNKTISASSNTLTGVINNTLTTTTGDIIYASSANTPARLGIGSSGQILTVSGGVPTWAAAASSGALTKVTAQTFTGVASVSVDNCFSATYDNYKVIIEVKTSATAQNIRHRWRVGGSDSTSSIYDTNYIYFFGGTGPTNASAANASSNLIVYGDPNNECYVEMLVYRPFNSSYETGYTGISISAEDTASTNVIGGNHNNAASYDGFTIFPQTSGNITGKVTVYGYQV